MYDVRRGCPARGSASVFSAADIYPATVHVEAGSLEQWPKARRLRRSLAGSIQNLGYESPR